MNQDAAYSSTELLAYAAAQMLQDNVSVFVGTGLPMIAAMLQRILSSKKLFSSRL